jgi:hypothetical protein
MNVIFVSHLTLTCSYNTTAETFPIKIRSNQLRISVIRAYLIPDK